MQKKRMLGRPIVLFFLLFALSSVSLRAEKKWTARWITVPETKSEMNTWLCFRKDIRVSKVPERLVTDIAADTKYWLWVNGRTVVFEGGLKRGPSPEDTYYDEIDIARFLKKGDNSIAVLVWYFGKDGFSHKSSGKPGLLFECRSSGFTLRSDSSWKVRVHHSYLPYIGIQPNFRLPESDICYDAGKDIGTWSSEEYDCSSWPFAIEAGIPPCRPWNKLILRPIPQWKDYGLKEYENKSEIPKIGTGDSVVCILPSNLQITPYLKIEAPAGLPIDIRTNHFMIGDTPGLQARYITKKGVQEYESLGWLNGERVIYFIPKGVKILSLKYRETGFDTKFAGKFHCSDDFFNRLWEKARRTLYVTMRDNYMDCPDRERAQWWGDEVVEGGEAFYAFDKSSSSLFRKGMYELIRWKKADSTLFAPIPAGNWDKELPDQSLAAVGYYGFWNYYLQSGDKKAISDLYEGVKQYLEVWKTKADGTLVYRAGGWDWGDWGEQIDMETLQNEWYYLALKGVQKMASALGKKEDADRYKAEMKRFKEAFHKRFWMGSVYRNPSYTGRTDDRVQALAVISGLANHFEYSDLLKVFQTSEYASPYMEKYVLEALFKMGEDRFALERMKKRFGRMVDDSDHSTLWEVWNGREGGTTNHAWSGGGLTLLSQYVCGISPVLPGYKRFQVAPQPGELKEASATVETVSGRISASFTNGGNSFGMKLSVPEKTEAVVKLPIGRLKEIKYKETIVWKNGSFTRMKNIRKIHVDGKNSSIKVGPGKWNFISDFIS